MNGPAIESLLHKKVWAVVGCSPNRSRASHSVAAFLLDEGYEVIPVNPSVDEVLGRRCYPDLASIPADAGVEVVDIFRRAEHAGGVVDEAIQMGAAGVWMQLGVIDHEAAHRAESAGLGVVMDRCPVIELPRLG